MEACRPRRQGPGCDLRRQETELASVLTDSPPRPRIDAAVWAIAAAPRAPRALGVAAARRRLPVDGSRHPLSPQAPPALGARSAPAPAATGYSPALGLWAGRVFLGRRGGVPLALSREKLGGRAARAAGLACMPPARRRQEGATARAAPPPRQRVARRHRRLRAVILALAGGAAGSDGFRAGPAAAAADPLTWSPAAGARVGRRASGG